MILVPFTTNKRVTGFLQRRLQKIFFVLVVNPWLLFLTRQAPLFLCCSNEPLKRLIEDILSNIDWVLPSLEKKLIPYFNLSFYALFFRRTKNILETRINFPMLKKLFLKIRKMAKKMSIKLYSFNTSIYTKLYSLIQVFIQSYIA